jgi:hypothetical protein
LKTLKNTLKNAKKKLEDLKKSGIGGRIWGCSSLLSKMKSYIDEEKWEDIPDIWTVQEIARYKSVKEIGSREVHTFIFDMNKTPKLKEKFTQHVNQIIDDHSTPENKKLELFTQLNT